jgi:sterol 24-C-methyltransferase
MATDRLEQIKDYYLTRESVIGYPLVLGGAKHFGYYPPEVRGLTMRQSLRIMEEMLGRELGLAPGSRVLDAGSGMGRVATYLARHFGFQMDGIDLLDFNVAEAKRFAKKHGVADTTAFQVGNYERLPFDDNTFDGLYSIETFVHATDLEAAYAEFRRVLKPGGVLLHHEYTITPLDDMPPQARHAYASVIEHTAMHALPHFTHGSMPGHLTKAGFTAVTSADITARTLPMWRRFGQLAALPYAVLRRIPIHERNYINAFSAVEWPRYGEHFRYMVTRAIKPATD